METLVKQIKRMEQFDSRSLGIFIRNQEEVMIALCKENDQVLFFFFDHLKYMQFDFNGCFCDRPLASIMLYFDSFIRVSIFKKLFDCGTDIFSKKISFLYTSTDASYYKILVQCASIHGVDNENWYDILMLFCEKGIVEALYEHNVDITNFIFNINYMPDLRTINMLIKYDKNNRIRNDLNKTKNEKTKDVLVENIYNLIFF